MHSKYKFYSGFVVKYAGNILKLQTKEDGLLYIIVGVGVLVLIACRLLFAATVHTALIIFVSVVGLAIMLYGVQIYYTTWTFDRLSGFLTRRRPGFPPKVYALDDILDAPLDSRKRGRHDEHRVMLKMSNSEWVPIGAFGRLDPQLEAQLAIREFLGMEE
jgi:hypothetical protein